MLRGIAAVIVGFILVIGLMALLQSFAADILGAERTLLPGTYEVTQVWTLVIIVSCIAASLFSGWVARLIAFSRKPVHVLGVIYLIIALMEVGATMADSHPGERVIDEHDIDASMKGILPAWLFIAKAILGYLGILIGGGFKKEPPLTNPRVA